MRKRSYLRVKPYHIAIPYAKPYPNLMPLLSTLHIRYNINVKEGEAHRFDPETSAPKVQCFTTRTTVVCCMSNDEYNLEVVKRLGAPKGRMARGL